MPPEMAKGFKFIEGERPHDTDSGCMDRTAAQIPKKAARRATELPFPYGQDQKKRLIDP